MAYLASFAVLMLEQSNSITIICYLYLIKVDNDDESHHVQPLASMWSDMKRISPPLLLACSHPNDEQFNWAQCLTRR